MWIALVLSVLSCCVVVMMVMDKTTALRAGVLSHSSGEELYPHLEPHLRRALRAIDHFLVQLSRASVHLVLVALARFTPWFYRWSHSVQQKLLNLIAAIKGKGILRELGAASVFIADLIAHKEQTSKGRLVN